MGNLEKRFFETKRETIIKSDDKISKSVLDVLKKCLKKGDVGSGEGTKAPYIFRLDSVYDLIS